MSQSKYSEALPEILATLYGESIGTNPHPQPDNRAEEQETIHVYPVELENGRGILFTKNPLEEETEPEQQPTVENQVPASSKLAPRTIPTPALSFVLILAFFLLLDSVGGILTDLFTPMATITITPSIRTISLQSTTAIGTLVSPITLSQSQTVPATGHGHQDAARATGSVTFYNGLFTQQYIAPGTVYTGSDGERIVTTQPAYIPAGNPGTGYGTVTVTAQAVQIGSRGNINAGDVNITIDNGLLVKNNPFYGGQDEREFAVVTKTDLTTEAAVLTDKVRASMSAALQEQLTATEQLKTLPCTPTMTADHRIGQEAATVTVTVALSCAAILYDTTKLQTQATQLLTTQAGKQFGQGYMLYGDVKVTITKASTIKPGVLLSFTTSGTFAYQLTTQMQQHIKTLIEGKPRLTVLQQLTTIPGIQHASVSGIADNQPLPDDPAHIHVLILFPSI